jgi:hypothetical protein
MSFHAPRICSMLGTCCVFMANPSLGGEPMAWLYTSDTKGRTNRSGTASGELSKPGRPPPIW